MIDFFIRMLCEFFHFLITILNGIEYVLIAYIIVGWIIFFGVIKKRDSMLLKIYMVMMAHIEPLLLYIRRFIPPIGFLDLSLLVIFFAIHIIKLLLYSLIRTILGI